MSEKGLTGHILIIIRGGATWGIRILDLLITSQPHYRAMQRWRYGCIRTRILMVLSKGRFSPLDIISTGELLVSGLTALVTEVRTLLVELDGPV